MEKITMIGLSGSGKTCFVYAMHNYMSISQDGFTFTAKDSDADLDLSDGWDKIVDGHWPKGSTISQEFEFYVQYASTKIMEFSWCDYRGNVLLEHTTNSDDAAYILNRINDSSCLVITIGADTMKEIIGGNERKTKEFARLRNLLNRFAAEQTRRIPIVIALTKADMYTQNEQKQVLDNIKNYFNILFVADAGWLVSIVPIQLGHKLGKDDDGSITGKIEPRNVQIPVLFFVSSILKEKAFAMSHALDNIKKGMSECGEKISSENEKGWWSKLWNGTRTPEFTTELDKLNQEEQTIIKMMPEIEKVLEATSEQFKVCKVFYNGKEIKI